MVKILTVLVGKISNSQVFLLKKCDSRFFCKNISNYAIFCDQSFNDALTNDIVSFEQLGPVCFAICWFITCTVHHSLFVLSLGEASLWQSGKCS